MPDKQVRQIVQKESLHSTTLPNDSVKPVPLRGAARSDVG